VKQAESLFTSRAKMAFRLADRDRDGKLSATEWANSARSQSPEFAKNDLKFPLSVEDFIALYLQANPRN
jgi:hypothetical protein